MGGPEGSACWDARRTLAECHAHLARALFYYECTVFATARRRVLLPGVDEGRVGEGRVEGGARV